MSEQEGVIKYQLEWTEAPAIAPFDFTALETWHQVFKKAGILGCDPELYDGYGFGNISERLNQISFLISGTQTGHLEHLAPEDYAVVVQPFIEENRIVAQGPVKPSSEALTHAAIYALDPDIRFVFHVHSPDIWQESGAKGLPQTGADIPYGTHEMAHEVKRLFEAGAFKDRSILAMAGHEDGIIGFGPSAEAAGEVIMKALQAPLLLG
jgi:ribulose-5-phosphate 4-epimerase/fuculose-1-phosphate aldolase